MTTLRKRAPNFSEEEKMRFLRILQEKGHPIVSKVTSHDLHTNKLKEESWLKITHDLNASGTIMRTTDNLKKLWQKMKTEAKVYKSQSFNQFQGTGGGPSKKFDDSVLEIVVQITGRGSTGIDSVEDSDYVTGQDVTPISPIPELLSKNVDSELSDVEFSIIKSSEIGADVEVSAIEDTPKHNYKRHRPLLEPGSNERAKQKYTRTKYTNAFAAERLQAEKEKISLIALQREHMIEMHKTQLENEKKQSELKNCILQEILNKIRDDKPVDKELMKIMFNTKE